MSTTESTIAGRPLDGAAAFEKLGLHADLVRAVADLEFNQPTAVQADAIPPGLAGHDVLACATTGSGKTAAFLLPILQRLRTSPRRGTRALVLTPTRELAAQVAEHFDLLARHTRLRCAAVYGGVGMRPQEDAFRRGVDLIVATPGRLLDHMRHDYARMSGLEVLVLDEADRMLDMGFLPDIRRVLRGLPNSPRQTLFFSATMPAPIVALSGELLNRPVRVNIARKAAPAGGITQALYPVPARLKVDLLIELLRQKTVDDAIVFCRTKHRANRLAEKLERMGFSTARMHGNRSQAQRTEALAGFKRGRYRVLVATDIVARGIDIEALGHVINFDVPAESGAYIHRVGRTARADATGDAYTLVAPEEEADVRAIESALGRPIERRWVDGFDYRAAQQEALEVPIAQRIAEIRARKAEERVRAAAKRERTAQPSAQRSAPPRAFAASTSNGQAGDGRKPRRRSRNRRSQGHGPSRNWSA